MDGETWIGVSSLNKILKQKIKNETDMITNQNFKFLYGTGTIENYWFYYWAYFDDI